VIVKPGEAVEPGPLGGCPVGLGVLEGHGGLGGEELRELELGGAEVSLGRADPTEIEGPDDLVAREERDDDQGLGFEGRPRDLDRARIEVGVVGQDRLAVGDRPAGESAVEGGDVAEDDVGVAVSGQDGPADAGCPVDPVDGERVVVDDLVQGVGDGLEDAGRIAGRHEPLGHLQESALPGELALEGRLLLLEPAVVLGVDEGLGGVRGEDREELLVVGGEAIPTLLADDDEAEGPRLGSHRDEEHRLRPGDLADDAAPGIGRRIADPDDDAVFGDPAGQAIADPDREDGRTRIGDAQEVTPEGDRLADAVRFGHAVDADRVDVEKGPNLGHDRLADGPDVPDPVEPEPEVLDRPQPRSEGLDRGVETGVADGHGGVFREAAGEGPRLVRPGVVAPVVEDEQRDRLGVEDDRDEADGLDALPLVDGPQSRVVRPRPVDDRDGALGEGAQSRGRLVAPQVGHDGEKIGMHATLGGEAEGSLGGGVEVPEADGVGLEEPPGAGHDGGEDGVEIRAGPAPPGHPRAAHRRSIGRRRVEVLDDDCAVAEWQRLGHRRCRCSTVMAILAPSSGPGVVSGTGHGSGAPLAKRWAGSTGLEPPVRGAATYGRRGRARESALERRHRGPCPCPPEARAR